MKIKLEEKEQVIGGSFRIICQPETGRPYIAAKLNYHSGADSILPREMVKRQALAVLTNLLKFHNQKSKR